MTKEGAELFQYAAGVARQQAAKRLGLTMCVEVQLLSGGVVYHSCTRVKDVDECRLVLASTITGAETACYGPPPSDGAWVSVQQFEADGALSAFWRCES